NGRHPGHFGLGLGFQVHPLGVELVDFLADLTSLVLLAIENQVLVLVLQLVDLLLELRDGLSLLGRGFLLLILGQLLLQGLFTGTGTGHRLIEARFRDANALFVLAALFLALLLLALLLGVGIRPFLALLPVLGV